MEAAELASAAATRLMELLATDGWSAVKHSVASLWRHSRPEQVEAELSEARTEVLRACETGRDDLRALLVAEWQARLIALLATRPEAVNEVRKLLPDPWHGVVEQRPPLGTTLEAHVSGGGSAFQAGRDLTIAKEGSETVCGRRER